MFTSNIVWENEIPVIKNLGAEGWTMARISRKYGVSRQRLKQIIDKHIPNWNDYYGRKVNQKVKEENHFLKWGVKESTDLYQAKRTKFRNKKASALTQGLTWSLEFGAIVWPTHCPILGIELDYFAETRQENSPSFDRIDCIKGYTNDNTLIISWRANRIKNDGTAEEHRKIATFLDNIQA